MKRLNILSVFALLSVLGAAIAQASVQEDFATTLDLVKQKFHDRYALEPWKTKALHWTIDDAAKRIGAEGAKDPNLTADGARTLIQDFFYSARDYHAKAIYSPGGSTSIPISVRSVGGKVFVTGVTDDCNCGVAVGDELVSFDGEPAMRSIFDRTTMKYLNHFESDVRDGERRLTNPYGMLMEKTPMKDTVDLVLRGVDGKRKTATLAWKKPVAFDAEFAISRAPAHPMVPESLQGWSKVDAGFGPRGAYFRKPEKTLWESASGARFTAWIAEFPGARNIFGNPGKARKIGYVRIPDFSPGQPADYTAAVKEFEATIAKMDAETDALILDENSNPGGMADYMYALASYFFAKEVPTFKFSYRLFPELVKDASDSLPDLEKITNDADAKAYFGGDDYFGFPVDLEFARDVKTFYQGLADDAKAGRKFGKPRFYDSAKIKPNPRVRYLKPLYILTDAYSVSCADFFPALFQDTKRAEILGGWTMGGGGFTGGTAVINSPLKTNYLIVPIALGLRLDDRTPIENLGVLPTRWFSPSPADYRNGFQTYSDSILKYIRKKIR
ncbi:MAG: PDZ domain-containing protein [Bdellovibrionales bacterium]|nr:PDZ domain-containing protein [Bdellovibrionales bacterium]